jgi:hypothetical protein
MEHKEFKAIIDNILISNRFYKKSNNWYKYTDECIALLNLQHSNFGSYYYINLAVFIKNIILKKNFQRGIMSYSFKNT